MRREAIQMLTKEVTAKTHPMNFLRALILSLSIE